MDGPATDAEVSLLSLVFSTANASSLHSNSLARFSDGQPYSSGLIPVVICWALRLSQLVCLRAERQIFGLFVTCETSTRSASETRIAPSPCPSSRR